MFNVQILYSHSLLSSLSCCAYLAKFAGPLEVLSIDIFMLVFDFFLCSDIRILGLCRVFWRIARLVGTVLRKKDNEIRERDVQLEVNRQHLGESRLEISRLEDSIRREVESKRKMERMLKSYRDEVYISFLHRFR